MSVVVSTPAAPVRDLAAADRPVTAERDPPPCPPFRDLIGRDDAVADIEATCHAEVAGVA